MKARDRARTTRRGRPAFALTAAIAALLCAAPGAAVAADRAVRLTADPSEAACTAFEPLDCSYFMARNGLRPAPVPGAPGAVEPTFINFAVLPGDVTIDAVIHDDGTVTVAEGDATFPSVDTVRPNALVGPVTVNAQIVQTGAWTGTFDEATGAMSLTAPLSLRFRLSCVPANGLCGGLTEDNGNMGTWAVASKNVPTLTTGHAEAPAPPAAYGPDWVPPVAEDGSPLDPATGALRLVDNTLELEHLEPSDCIDLTSAICRSPGVAGLVVVELNNAIGALWDGANPANTRDTVPGAIDMSMAFVMEDALIKGTPSVVEFGSQPLGTSSAPRDVEVLAFGDTDVELLSLYTSGGDAADFWIANDGCLGTVATDAACTVKVRFNPSESGNRATGLVARVRDPQDPDRIRTLQIATLSGIGGQLPQGPSGPAGNAGPQGPASTAGSGGSQGSGQAAPEPPSVRRVRARLRLSSRGTATVATITCPQGSCRVTSRSARLRIGSKAYRIAVTGDRTMAAGKSARVRVSVSKSVRRALRRRGTGALTVRLVVRSSNGASVSRTIGVRLRAR